LIDQATSWTTEGSGFDFYQRQRLLTSTHTVRPIKYIPEESLSEGEVAGAWSWPLTSI